MAERDQLGRKIKEVVIGGARNPQEPGIFHKISLIAFFAWIGLGADGLSSSSYGPEEAFKNLAAHPHLGLFVALLTALTIFVIATSYSQIIELFPSGGGGYLVASKLLSPKVGMVSGCALLVDYALTISVSITVGADTLFGYDFIPKEAQNYKLLFEAGVLAMLILLNLRGVKESVGLMTPIFLVFVAAHAFLIVYAVVAKAPEIPDVCRRTAAEASGVVAESGFLTLAFLVLRAYSLGAGTYTGIEAVSNGLPILREPRVRTGKRTMTYMWVSLAITVVGLMVAYLLFHVETVIALPENDGKTFNTLLLYKMTAGWGSPGTAFLIVTLLSEAALLFVAAQTGFLDGPRVMANMATDRWFPSRLSMLSDRLVIKNGIVLMGGAALLTLVVAHWATSALRANLPLGEPPPKAVDFLVVLYSINVFITFALSQTGMVRHWWTGRKTEPKWVKKFIINGTGLVLTVLILCWNVIEKFDRGGWATLVITGTLITLAALIKRHYKKSGRMVDQLDSLAMAAIRMTPAGAAPKTPPAPDPNAKTAVLLVNGFNGLGIHALMNIFRFFGDTFKNFVFVQVGLVDTGSFKGAAEVEKLGEYVKEETQKYVDFVQQQGYYAEAATAVGADIVEEIETLADGIVRKYPEATFFAGQLLFPDDSFIRRLLHNNITFALQRRLYHKGVPFMMLPIRVLPETAGRPASS